MMIFERVDSLIKRKRWARSTLAEHLGVPQNTFNRYFCETHQGKLTQYLWPMLEIFPDVRRDWLFFNEGDMLTTDAKDADARANYPLALKADRVTKLEDEMERMKQDLLHIQNEHGALTTELLSAQRETMRLLREKSERNALHKTSDDSTDELALLEDYTSLGGLQETPAKLGAAKASGSKKRV